MATDNQQLVLDQFLPFKMVDLSEQLSSTLSGIYSQEFNLTIAQWRILARLAEQSPLSSKELLQLTSMDKSRVSRAIKEMEQQSWLQRKKADEDNRISKLSLTAAGRELYQQIAPRALAWEADLLSSLDKTEYQQLLAIMDKLQHRVHQMANVNS